MKNVSFTGKDKKSGTNPRLLNILRFIYMFLKQDWSRLDYYAVQLDCKSRTVKSYITDINSSFDNVEQEGFDINYDRSKKHYEIRTGRYTFIPVETHRLTSIFEVLNRVSAQQGSPFDIFSFLKEKIKKYLFASDGADIIGFSSPKVESRTEKWFQVISNAITEQKALLIEYENRREVIFPSFLIVHDYEWYLRAFSEDKLKTYEINRVEFLDTEDYTGEKNDKVIPGNEHIWDWVDDTNRKPVKVRLRFSEPLTGVYSEKFKYRKEHPSQEIDDMPYEIKKRLEEVDEHIKRLDGEIKKLKERLRSQRSKIFELFIMEDLERAADRRLKLLQQKDWIIKDHKKFLEDDNKRHLEEREENKGREFLVSYDVKNPENMVPWILKYGSQVEVLEPIGLKIKIKEEANKIVSLYNR